MFAIYIPLQQHLSSVSPVSLQSNFPFFCFSQQHVFTALPVKVQVISGAAGDAIVAIVNGVITGSHFVILFINSPPPILQVPFSTRWSHVQGQLPIFGNFAA
jgi:hypothetical protein